MTDFVLPAKRALRPLIPDRIMARYRLRQHSEAARANVDVVVADPAEARRWLSATPDTYRVIDPAGLGEPPPEVVVLPTSIPDAGLTVSAARLLSRSDIGAAVVGEVTTPRLVDRRRTEPLVAPTVIVIRPEVLDEIGGLPAGDHPLPGLFARVGDAGHRIGLIPVPQTGVDPARRDQISADPVVILAAVPMHDVGGGSRGAQLALELLRHGYHVTYVHLYPSYESVDLGLRYIHPALEQVRFDRFDGAAHAGRAEHGGGLAILELPAQQYVDAVTDLHHAGWDLVYDIIDDWSDPALGGDWYDAGLEAHFIDRADALTASAPDLAHRAAATGHEATLVPNAVNEALFAGVDTARPDDLPSGHIIGYHGSLYGNWFDWDALATVACQYPESSVVLIGDARGVPDGLPGNVVFLGLKPQRELPAYLSRFDVGIVPFAVTPTSHAVSPLKVYEYLASGVPVAAPPLRALEGLDGVHTGVPLTAAVASALDAPKPDGAQALRLHSWSQRLNTFFDALGRTVADPAGDDVKVQSRPAVHYPRRERKVK